MDGEAGLGGWSIERGGVFADLYGQITVEHRYDIMRKGQRASIREIESFPQLGKRQRKGEDILRQAGRHPPFHTIQNCIYMCASGLSVSIPSPTQSASSAFVRPHHNSMCSPIPSKTLIRRKKRSAIHKSNSPLQQRGRRTNLLSSSFLSIQESTFPHMRDETNTMAVD